MWRWFKWVLITVSGLVLLLVVVTAVGNYGHIKDTDYNNPPVFVTADFIDLSRIDTISKFRSGVGHDYSGNGETCRSMRHYFGNSSKVTNVSDPSEKLKIMSQKPDPATGIEIYAPADGWLLNISGENTPVGKQIEFAPDNGQGYHIRLDHVYPDKGIHMFMRVKAGQRIGLINDGQAVDMSVFYIYRGQFRLVSYFQVMTAQVFAKYQARGIKNRSDLIIPKEVVDANPWRCENQKSTPSFAENYSDTPEGEAFNNVHLSGWVKQIDYKK